MTKKENEKLVPNLRFKGFTDDWIQEKLGNSFDIITGGTPSRKNNNYWNPGEIPWLSSGEINKKRIKDTDEMISKEGLDNSSTKLIPENSILIALAGQGKTRGKVAVTYIETTTNQSLAAFVSYSNEKSEFLYYALDRDYDKLRAASSGDGTRGGLNKKILSDYQVKFPSLAEQIKISLLLKKLDNIITLEQEKLKIYKEFKKTLLSQLFTTSENIIPEIRFKNFNDKWIQRELKDITSITMGQSPSSKNYTDDPNDYILVQGNADLKEGRVSPRIWTTEVTKTAKPGDIILTVRAPVGDVALNDYHIVLGRGVSGLKGSHFVYQLLKRMNMINYWKKYSTGSTFESINSTDIKTAPVLVPNESEQDKIGKMLKQLDDIIIHEQHRIEKLNEIKKTLLNNLFV